MKKVIECHECEYSGGEQECWNADSADVPVILDGYRIIGCLAGKPKEKDDKENHKELVDIDMVRKMICENCEVSSEGCHSKCIVESAIDITLRNVQVALDKGQIHYKKTDEEIRQWWIKTIDSYNRLEWTFDLNTIEKFIEWLNGGGE